MSRRIKHLYTYPIKSCYPQEHLNAFVFNEGLQHDRELALIDSHGKLLTGRKYPKLASIRVKLSEGMLAILHQAEQQQFQLGELGTVDVSLFDMKFKAVKVSDEASLWFSSFLGIQCTLVRNNALQPRYLKAKYGYPESNIYMPDSAPILLINSASVNELNAKSSETIKPIAFRPNIIIDGLLPREELEWEKVQIGDTIYAVIAACKRCKFTTLNYYTFEFNKSREPLLSLAKYSTNHENKIIFGVYLLPLSSGSIAVNDELKVLVNTPEHSQ